MIQIKLFTDGGLIIFLEDITLLHSGNLMNFIIMLSSEVHKWLFPIWIGKEEPTTENIIGVWKTQDRTLLLTIPIFAHTPPPIEVLVPVGLGKDKNKFILPLQSLFLSYFDSSCLSLVHHQLLSGLLETITSMHNLPCTLISEFLLSNTRLHWVANAFRIKSTFLGKYDQK